MQYSFPKEALNNFSTISFPSFLCKFLAKYERLFGWYGKKFYHTRPYRKFSLPQGLRLECLSCYPKDSHFIFASRNASKYRSFVRGYI